jgi:23S rRNA (uridine2552-2'-O)-methyltransferase
MRSKSSAVWLQQHFADFYVKKSQQEGYRSRAVYKLIELHQAYKLFKPGMNIIDLGAAPGGWSQYLSKLLATQGRIIAVDVLAIAPLDGVTCVQGDFTAESTQQQIINCLTGGEIHWILSDISPNLSGITAIDQPRAMYLIELVLDFAINHRSGGLVLKVFQGEGFDQFLRNLRQLFVQVILRKPKASRRKSREIYIIAQKQKIRQ